MASSSSSASAASVLSSLPPDLFEAATIYSLLSTVLLVAVAYGASLYFMPAAKARSSSSSSSSSPSMAPTATLRFLFIWHAADALCHFILEGSWLYHCFFSHVPVAQLDDGFNSTTSGLSTQLSSVVWPTPDNYLGTEGLLFGPQAGGSNPLAQLWMVYARADRRWAGADVNIISIELLTVLFDGPLSVYICYCIAKQDPKVYIWMIILATCEIYGGFMTFCPEWLTGNMNLDTGNFMYLWVYLSFFNLIWVFIPLFVTYHSVQKLAGSLQPLEIKQKTT